MAVENKVCKQEAFEVGYGTADTSTGLPACFQHMSTCLNRVTSPAPTEKQCFAEDQSFVKFGKNCNCGARTEEWSASEYPTAASCGAKCAASPRPCASFGVWLSSSRSAGHCALFDTPCVDVCPNPTNVAAGYMNIVYNNAAGAGYCKVCEKIPCTSAECCKPIIPTPPAPPPPPPPPVLTDGFMVFAYEDLGKGHSSAYLMFGGSTNLQVEDAVSHDNALDFTFEWQMPVEGIANADDYTLALSNPQRCGATTGGKCCVRHSYQGIHNNGAPIIMENAQVVPCGGSGDLACGPQNERCKWCKQAIVPPGTGTALLATSPTAGAVEVKSTYVLRIKGADDNCDPTPAGAPLRCLAAKCLVGICRGAGPQEVKIIDVNTDDDRNLTVSPKDSGWYALNLPPGNPNGYTTFDTWDCRLRISGSEGFS